MLLTQKSLFSGKSHTRDIPVKEEDLDRWLKGGINIQQAMPYLSPDDREFLLTGVTPEEWQKAFAEDDA